MKNSLTIAFLTSRHDSKLEWMLGSLLSQMADPLSLMVIDLHHPNSWNHLHRSNVSDTAPLHQSLAHSETGVVIEIEHYSPKPNPWQGGHRLLKDQWWAKSSAINTALCLCKTDWIMFMDDRCVLGKDSMNAVRDAMNGGYAIAGSYEKRHNMKVEGGVIIEPGTLDGTDPRSPGGQDHRGFNRMSCGGGWWFGCCNALPVEWMLQINGAPEDLDGSSHEDCVIGGMLERNHYPMMYEPRLFVTQDRTPGQCGPDIRRSSRERFPHDRFDRVHSALRRYQATLCSLHHLNLRAIREAVQRGEPFPGVETYPALDWWNGKEIKEWDNIP